MNKTDRRRYHPEQERPPWPDASGHVYKFGTFTLRAGYAVTVHTGNGLNRPLHRFWRSDGYIWNNDGDTARLRNAFGTLVDRCSYSGAGAWVNC